jgi:hypothetical protein
MLNPGDIVNVLTMRTDKQTGKMCKSTIPAKVIMSQIPGKTLLDFGDVIETVDNKNIIKG